MNPNLTIEHHFTKHLFFFLVIFYFVYLILNSDSFYGYVINVDRNLYLSLRHMKVNKADKKISSKILESFQRYL
jgi:hypothetical protein